MLLDQELADEALREFAIALELNPHDKAIAHFRLAKAHHALGNKEASQTELLLALDVAPNYRPAQRLLLELMSADSGT
jgi:tetratricopeptide (TPR) repeat protein